MSNHTPGPWEILTYDWGDKFSGVKPFIGPFGNYVIQSKTEEPFIAFVNGFANARLIAAAPEMFEFIKEIKENHLEPGLFIEKVEADWIRIMTPIVDFLLKHTPALVDALARTIVVEGYGEGGGVVNPDAHIFTDTKAALQRFKDTWAWMVRAHEHRGIESRLEKAVTLLKRLEGEEV